MLPDAVQFNNGGIFQRIRAGRLRFAIDTASMARKNSPTLYTPGPSHEAAARAYYERGSAEKILANHWRTFSYVLVASLVAMSLAIWQMIPLKTVEVFVASRQEGGRLSSEEMSGNWAPDQDMVLYFLGEWTGNLVEVNLATWERTTARAIEFTGNTGVDLTRDFLRRPENNPAVLLKDNPNFVRNFELVSSNFLRDGSALIRYRTISRSGMGNASTVANFAITINYVRIKPTTRRQALANPSGLAVTSFNISEESAKK